MSAQDDDERDQDGVRGQDSATEADDDFDERLDDLDEMDELVAVFAATHRCFVPESSETTWSFHAPRSPRAPHPEDTLRPPIAI